MDERERERRKEGGEERYIPALHLTLITASKAVGRLIERETSFNNLSPST